MKYRTNTRKIIWDYVYHVRLFVLNREKKGFFYYWNWTPVYVVVVLFFVFGKFLAKLHDIFCIICIFLCYITYIQH